MSRDDIYGALKNALERGATIQQAIQTLVNSGYNDMEVKKVAQEMSRGVLSEMAPQTPQTPQIQTPQIPAVQRAPTQAQYAQPIPQTVSPRMQTQQTKLLQPPNQRLMVRHKAPIISGRVIILFTILIILIGALAATIIFRNSVTDFLGNIL